VLGQEHFYLRKHLRRFTRSVPSVKRSVRGRARFRLEELETRSLLSASGLSPDALIATPNVSLSPNSTQVVQAPFTPTEIQQAYSVTPLLNGTATGKAINGSGVTIAIVDAYNDPNIIGDANKFSSATGLPSFNSGTGSPSLKVVNATGGSAANLQTNAGWATETSLDVEWAHAIAPGANILLVEASSPSDAALMQAVQYGARNASVVSMSWGGPEWSGQASYDQSVFNANYGHPVTFVASAGDSGAGPEWPSSSPYVLSVGGTTLSITATTTNGSTTYKNTGESAWSQGGGGPSTIEGEPSYQTAVQATGARTTPDVSYDANPSSGVEVYDSIKYQGYSGFYGVGGTSAGAPQWAALVALADQARGGAANGLSTSQVEKTLYSIATGANYHTDFNDVTSGSNGYQAGSGYDLVTGLGSPIASKLVPALAGTTASSSITVGAAPRQTSTVFFVYHFVSVDPTSGTVSRGEGTGGDTSPTAPTFPLLPVALPPILTPSASLSFLSSPGVLGQANFSLPSSPSLFSAFAPVGLSTVNAATGWTGSGSSWWLGNQGTHRSAVALQEEPEGWFFDEGAQPDEGEVGPPEIVMAPGGGEVAGEGGGGE
jgi:subtilase family serine protease